MENSPYQVIVLFEGYSRQESDGTAANCSCTLIKGPLNIVVDTMTAWDGPRLEAALEKEDVSKEDINFVVCTHGHSDHIGCNYLFQNATHIVGFCISHRESYKDNSDLISGKEMRLDEFVTVIPTPGHTLEDVSVTVETSDKGTVAITGDLFENQFDLKDDDIWKTAGTLRPDLQQKNRLKMLQLADWIVPGHGSMFPVI